MEKIICDSFTTSTNTNGGMRFNGGLPMFIIDTKDKTLSYKSYFCIELICCSSVRTTDNNWFYYVNDNLNNTTKEHLSIWIDEIAPIFPELDIKFISYDSSKIWFKYEDTKPPLLNLDQELNGKRISIPITLSNRSNRYYGTTRADRYPTGELSNILFIIEDFLKDCITIKINITKDNFKDRIEDFISKYYSSYIEDPNFRENFYSVDITVGSETYSETYNVDLNQIVDIETISKESFTEYLMLIVEKNLETIKDYLLLHISETTIKVEEYSFIQALYSNKISNVQGYFAHHLIRAGFSSEFHPFIDQYFLIKKSLPDIGFWNTLFLTQFGFNYYYYYWITAARIINPITDKEMTKQIKSHSGNSTLYFLEPMILDLSSSLKTKAIELYKAGKFDSVFTILSGGITVELYEKSKGKFKNLRLSSTYSAVSEEDNYYFIKGDDYIVRRYSKKNFKQIL